MAMGAVKPGTPATGGKGAAQPSRPTLAPAQGASIPAQGGKTAGPQNTLQPGSQIFGGTVTPNTIGPNGLPVGGTMPAGYTSPIPAQGGKFPSTPQQPTTSNIPGYLQPYANALNPQVQQLAPGQVPAQGGKGTSQQDYDSMMARTSFSGAPPTYEEFVQNRLNPKPMPQVMPQKPGIPSQLGDLGLSNALYGGGGQQPTTTTPSNIPGYAQSLVPAQGGKSSGQGGNPEQLAYLQSVLDASRPQTPSNVPSYAQQVSSFGQAPQPAPVMPTPAPVMPRPAMTRPTMRRPSLIGAGLAGLRGRR